MPQSGAKKKCLICGESLDSTAWMHLEIPGLRELALRADAEDLDREISLHVRAEMEKLLAIVHKDCATEASLLE